MIDARRNFPAVAFKGLAGIIGAAVDFVVAVGESAARQPDAEVRVRTQPVDKAEFGIQIYRRHRQTQGQIGAQKIRLVVIIIRVAGKRRVALQGLIVADLDQVALDRVNLREPRIGANNVSHSSARPNCFIAVLVTQSCPASKRESMPAHPFIGHPDPTLPAGHGGHFAAYYREFDFALMSSLNSELLAKAKGLGFSDRQIAHLTGSTEDKIRARRKKLGLVPSYRLVDTCAAEFEAYTPYYYSTYDRGDDEVQENAEEKGDDPRRRPQPHRPGN